MAASSSRRWSTFLWTSGGLQLRPDPASNMARKIAALLFVALGAFAAYYALGLRMYTSAGPGAGLFPFAIGVLLAATGCAWLVQVAREAEGPPVLPGREALARIALQVGALALFALLLPTLGYIPSAIALAVLTALIAGERSWPWIAAVAAICSVGVSRLFELLGTPL